MPAYETAVEGNIEKLLQNKPMRGLCIGVMTINSSQFIGKSVNHNHLGFNGGHYRSVCKYCVIQMLRTEACNLTCFQE